MCFSEPAPCRCQRVDVRACAVRCVPLRTPFTQRSEAQVSVSVRVTKPQQHRTANTSSTSSRFASVVPSPLRQRANPTLAVGSPESWRLLPGAGKPYSCCGQDVFLRITYISSAAEATTLPGKVGLFCTVPGSYINNQTSHTFFFPNRVVRSSSARFGFKTVLVLMLRLKRSLHVRTERGVSSTRYLKSSK